MRLMNPFYSGLACLSVAAMFSVSIRAQETVPPEADVPSVFDEIPEDSSFGSFEEDFTPMTEATPFGFETLEEGGQAWKGGQLDFLNSKDGESDFGFMQRNYSSGEDSFYRRTAPGSRGLFGGGESSGQRRSRVQLTGSLGLAYNDNVNLADSGKEDDFILSPRIAVGHTWAISPSNSLRTSLGFGYNYYINGTRSGFLTVSPGTHWDYQFGSKYATITLFNDLSVGVDPIGRTDISGSRGSEIDFRSLGNRTGMAISYDLTSDTRVSGGYDFGLERSLSNDFKQLDRNDHSIRGAIYRTLSPRLTLGLTGSYSWSDYIENTQNGSKGFFIGPTATLRVSDFFMVDGRIGFQHRTYNRKGSISDNSDFSGLSYSVGAEHVLSKRLTHRVDFRQGAGTSLNSNFSDQFSAQYSLRAILTKNISLVTGLDYERFKSSARTGDSGDRWMGTLGTSYQLLKQTRLGMNYRLSLKDSDQADRDYIQNLVTLTLTQQF